ncbi:GerMN domain-containing protein [Anaerosacchariphilus polymeriproducens]|uniref:GerMN domain-containing protein n=1 Tax=Anaerosacchariphilus polymeriproducens TaxID=1812858 RepID=A0A371AWM5_9FIRM|nr:GerMN domain-containing protein [Anaerosacchariphilus polymeriproducens]RDU23984.1 hypothetical protein DWV06_06730 [Anaerosacchariphilus polymeriproducens]
MKKFNKIMILFILISISCIACKNQKTEKAGAIDIYYINNQISGLVPYEHVLKGKSQEEKLKEVIKMIQDDPVSIDCKRAFTENIKIVDYILDNNRLEITFNDAYLGMETTREVLCRASIVKTVTQLDFVQYVVFKVQDAPLTDYKGNPIGVMTKDSFIDNTKEQINSVQAATLKLYFSNKKGDQLIEEIQDVHYSSNMPIEKVVVQQLIAGPAGDNGYQSISPDTKIISISQKDGVCYVDFNEKFLEGIDGVSKEIGVYSVVNSLSEVPGINKVQISINGDTKVSISDKIKLNNMLERNLDLIESKDSIKNEVELP